MFIMQSNDSRLVKAAKRTIRAEATLVIIIIIITSWSVYALYKIAIENSDSILGINISRVFGTDNNKSSINGHDESSSSWQSNQGGENSTGQQQDQIIYSKTFNPILNKNNSSSIELLATQQNLRNHLLQEILAKRRQLFGDNNYDNKLSQKPIFLSSNFERNFPIVNEAYKTMPPYQTTFNNILNNLQHHLRQQQQKSNAESINNSNNLLQSTKITPNYSTENDRLLLMKTLPSLLKLQPNLNADTGSSSEHSRLPEPSEDQILSSLIDEDDYSNQKHNNDETDRQAAESNNNQSEQQYRFRKGNKASIISDNDTDKVTLSQNNESNDNDMINNRDEEANNVNDSTSETDNDNSIEEEPTQTDEKSNSSDDNNDQNDNNQTNDPIDDGSLRETGHAIAEEVDRMSQPSSSDVVSQQEHSIQHKPFDYKSTVQFDDSLSGSSATGIMLPTYKQDSNILQKDKKQVIPGSLVARFVDPKPIRSSAVDKTLDKEDDEKATKKKNNNDNKNIKINSTNGRKEEEKKIKRLDLDLEVDHNSLFVSNGAKEKKTNNNLINNNKKQINILTKSTRNDAIDSNEKKTARKKELNNNKDDIYYKSATISPPEKELDTELANDKRERKKLSMKREKRFIENYTNFYKIDGPNEIENYSNKLNLGSLIGQNKVEQQSSDIVSAKRKPKSINDINNEQIKTNQSLAVKNQTNDDQQHTVVSSSNRRSDYEEDDDGSQDENDTVGGDNESNQDDSTSNNDDGNSNDSTLDDSIRERYNYNILPKYHYISSNDTDLQNLLAEKQLLDVLSQSRLPSPSHVGSMTTNNPTIEHLTKTNHTNHNNNEFAKPSNDHQTSGSIYTVDHGLLLYPSADEESHYKSKSELKKKKKHGKMKKKKKMTIAMKKGGHKKKKHKKMEKKFLKEKKFKGAKKGKKMSKGKGGQGGKKGKKFYKDKGFKKKGFKNVYHKEEFGQKKSYFDEFRDKAFKKKWKKFNDDYGYKKLSKFQAKDTKGAKNMKHQKEGGDKYDKGKYKKKYQKEFSEFQKSKMKKKKHDGF